MRGWSRVKRAQLLLSVTHLSWIQSDGFLKFISLEVTAEGETEETEIKSKVGMGRRREPFRRVAHHS